MYVNSPAFTLDQRLTDRDLIQGCIHGNREYQFVLYDRYASIMYAICLRYAGDSHQAQDILQEGFIKVYNKLDKFRFEGSFEGWMKRVFIHSAIEYHRRNQKHKYWEEYEIACQNQSFDSQVLETLAAKELLALIQQLPVGYRTIFNLNAIEGYTHREIGEMLHISEGTSKSQLSRARAVLQQMIKDLRN